MESLLDRTSSLVEILRVEGECTYRCGGYMIRLILVSALLVLSLCVNANAAPNVFQLNNTIRIPAPVSGNLIIYRVGFTQCSIFLSDEGMAKGTGAPSCIVVDYHGVRESGFEFEILDVISTTDD